MTALPFIDIEASGFGAGSYPIEVGFILPDGSSYCSLIIPEDDWKHWDSAAEKVHGITRELLFQHGRSSTEVARVMKEAMPKIREYRKSVGDAYSFNWSLRIEPEFQLPFEPDHASMASLDLHRNQPPQLLAANLRRAFSGIVAGNVKEGGIRAIEKKGPFKLHGDKELMHLMDRLLESFVRQQRMKLPGSQYIPCYEIVK